MQNSGSNTSLLAIKFTNVLPLFGLALYRSSVPMISWLTSYSTFSVFITTSMPRLEYKSGVSIISTSRP
jgi:hypothetical protein